MNPVCTSDGLKDRQRTRQDVETQGRIHNFGAGPAVLPLEVVQEFADTLPNLDGSGFGLLEVSHRSEAFQEVIDSAMNRLRNILDVPDEYEVLFLQGGASTQFYMTALNLLERGEKADFIVTGGWSQKAIEEAGRVGDVVAAWDDSENGFRSVPENGDYSIRDDAKYVHYTSNNTLFGTQFHHLPDSQGKPRVVDASSDICGVPLDVSQHDVIYAGGHRSDTLAMGHGDGQGRTAHDAGLPNPHIQGIDVQHAQHVGDLRTGQGPGLDGEERGLGRSD